MKKLATAILIAISAPIIAQDLSRKVDYEAAGLPAKRVLADLSALTNIQLEPSPQTAAEILVVRAKSVPLTTLMAQIARATSGVWRQERSLYRLEADGSARQKEAQDELNARIKAVQKAIDLLVKPPKSQGDAKGSPDANSIAVQIPFGGAGSGDPGSRAIVKMLPSIGARVLAQIPRDGRIVFSTNPTRTQIPFMGNMSAIIDNLVSENNRAVKARQDAEDAQSKTKEQEQAEQFARLLGFEPQNNTVDSPPSKILLVASRQAMFDAIGLQLRLYDARGRILLTGTHMLPLDMGMFGEFAAMMGGPVQQPPKQPGPDKEIVFGDRSLKVQSFFKNVVNAAQISRQPMPPEIKAILLHPEKDDPLSFVHGEAVLQVAKEKGLNAVASLPDSMVSLFGTFFSPAKLTVDAYLNELQSGRNTTAEIKDGWLIVRPSKPVGNRRARADRFALAGLLAASDAKGAPSLDDLAAYALKSEPPMESPASMIYLGLFAPNTMNQGFGGMVNWNMLRFYGGLSTGQRQTAADGAPISFGAFSQPQRESLSRILFGAGTKLQIDANRRGQQSQDEGNPMINMIKNFMPATSKEFRDEPTEIMPNGLPGDGFMTLKIDGGQFAMIASQDKGPTNMYGALGADEIAMMRYFKEDPQFSAFQGFMPSLDRLMLGNRETLTFKFYVAPNVAQTETLRNDNMPKNSQPIAYDQMPAAFRARIDDRIAAMKKFPIPFGAMMSRGLQPPP